MSRTKNKGNVLFIVLLGVVLFGALTYTIVNSNSDSGDTGSIEQDKINASEIIRYAKTMKSAVDRMLGKGISENQLSFAYPDLDSDYGTFGTTPKYEVFNYQGGGMSYEKPKASWIDEAYKDEVSYGDWVFTSHNSVTKLGTTSCSAGECNELLIMLPYVKRSVCVMINHLLGIDELDIEPDLDAAAFRVDQYFDGTFVSGNGIGSGGDSKYNALQAYCIKADGIPEPGSYHFYLTLIIR